MSIYVASSWRNHYQPAVVSALRSLKLEVYDFHHPEPGNNGFRWDDIDPQWKSWTPAQYRDALKHPIMQTGFTLDLEAMERADTCVLVLPSGRSASFEFGWCVGREKRGIVFMPEKCEPELMYMGNQIVTSLDELLDTFAAAKGEVK